MADIAMCRNKGCNLREKCYRYTAPVNEYGQTVLTNMPCENPCKWYWDNTGKPDGRKLGYWWEG